MPSPVAALSPRLRAVPAVAAVAGGSVTLPWRICGRRGRPEAHR
jgi:hypothetical protein